MLADLATHLDLVVDYGWLWWITSPLFWLLTMIQSVVINWGVAIIFLTLLVKLAFFQLSAAGYKFDGTQSTAAHPGDKRRICQ